LAGLYGLCPIFDSIDMLRFDVVRVPRVTMMMLVQARAVQVRGANLSDEIPNGISSEGIRMYRTDW
jgi:hypothetical protein